VIWCFKRAFQDFRCFVPPGDRRGGLTLRACWGDSWSAFPSSELLGLEAFLDCQVCGTEDSFSGNNMLLRFGLIPASGSDAGLRVRPTKRPKVHSGRFDFGFLEPSVVA
jgi:hypothetical protein